MRIIDSSLRSSAQRLAKGAFSLAAGCCVGLSILTAGCQSTPTGGADLQSGYRSLEARDYDAAIAQADAYLSKSPAGKDAAAALYLRGRGLEGQNVGSDEQGQGNFRAARDAYQQALSSNPNRRLESLIRAGLGNTNYWLEDFDAAARHWANAYEMMDDQNARSYILYRVGLCYQRMGDFAGADQRFAMVQQQFPGTDAANRAREKTGYKEFNVQVGTFANPQTAGAVISQLQRQGYVVRRGSDSSGHTVVSIGPFPNYLQAGATKNRLAGSYPTAMIMP